MYHYSSMNCELFLQSPSFSAILCGFYGAKFITLSEESNDEEEDEKQQNLKKLGSDIEFYGNVLKILLETCTEPGELTVVSRKIYLPYYIAVDICNCTIRLIF